jgi:hypothetical protein
LFIATVEIPYEEWSFHYARMFLPLIFRSP